MNFLTARPIAHRGLHDRSRGLIENSLCAFRAAMERGYAIECDVQLSADGKAMVFHDAVLDRLTGLQGNLRDHSANALADVPLTGSSDTIHTLREHLDIVDGAVPLVVELKSLFDGNTRLVEAVADAASGYGGDLAVMSFDPALCARFRELMPERPRGLTATGGAQAYDAHIAAMQDHDLNFISYDLNDLPCRFVAEQREAGVPVISWTVRTPQEAERSAHYADQITFESFLP